MDVITDQGIKTYDRTRILDAQPEELGGALFYCKFLKKQIEEDSAIGQILLNSKIVDLCRTFLQSSPYLVNLTALLHKEDRNNIYQSHAETNSQSWHIDFAHLKFLKVFIFLSDVQVEENGPHMFVEGSQDHKIIYPENSSDFVESRKTGAGNPNGSIKDEWVRNQYDKDQIKTFFVEAGDMLIESTSGLHKGSICTQGNREVLQLLFASSNYGHLYADRQSKINFKSEYEHLKPFSENYRQEYLSGKNFINKIRNKLGKILGGK